jgi:iron-sulfur cluster assembly accessory protein
MTTPIETKITSTGEVTMTAAAVDVVKGLLQERNLDATYALRIYIAGRSCSGFQYGMALDNTKNDSDSTFHSGGINLVIDEGSMEYMSGASVDFIDDERGKGFFVDNPNAAPACSCESGSCGN